MLFSLAIDSTDRALHLALTDSGNTLIAYRFEDHERVVESLSSLLNDLLKEARVSFDQLAQITICLGPGSFTGIRSAISSALGIKLAIDCKLFGVSTHLARSVDKFAKNKVLVPHLMLNDQEACYVIIACGLDARPKTVSDFYLISKNDLDKDIDNKISESGLNGKNIEIFSIDLSVVEKPAYLLSKAQILEDLDLGLHFQRGNLSPLYVKGVNAKTIEERRNAAREKI